MMNRDPCSACDGTAGHPVILAADEDFTISRGWARCEACGGTGRGEDQRRREAALEQQLQEVFDD